MIELLNMDCMEYMKGVEDKKFDLLLQDTPFGCTQNKWDIKPDLKLMWPHWERVAKDNAAMIFFATQPFASELILSNQKIFRYDLIWYKALCSGFLNAKKMPLRNHEHILVFYKKSPVYNPQMGIGIRKKGRVKNERLNSNYGKFGVEKIHLFDDKGTRYPQSVLDFTNGDRIKQNKHPTQKPLDLIRYLIKSYTNVNDTVLDGYSGSGTTAEACYLENRNAVCCEIDKDYYEAGFKRVSEAMKQQVLFNYEPEEVR